jgi:hypothetical protein
MEHNYQPVDLRDKEACGATEEGMDNTYRQERQRTEPKKKIIT